MKPMLLPAEQMEGPKGKEQRNYISAAVYWGNELGVEGFMTNIRDIVANLINTLIYILLSARLEWKWLSDPLTCCRARHYVTHFYEADK